MASNSGIRRRMIGNAVSSLCTKMNRTKKIPGDNAMETPLNRCLNTFDITLLGNSQIILCN